MATNTIKAFFIGNFADLDPTEGNTDSENASILVGQVLGSSGDPFYDNIEQITTDDVGNDGIVEDNDTGAADTITYNGSTYVLDSTQAYNATITYADGTTASALAVVVQDVNGNVFLVPWVSGYANNDPFQHAPIETISLDSLAVSDAAGVSNNQEQNAFVGGVDGTSGDDTISNGYSDSDADVVDNDGSVIYGNGGNDIITGGSGADIIDGGGDNDSILGGEGADSLLGGDGSDTIHGGLGDDTLSGGAGNDVLDGFDDNDTLLGGDGDDTLLAGYGSDVFDGGDGTDTYQIGGTEVDVFAFDIDLTAGPDNWGNTYTSIENVIGGTQDDTIVGSSDANLIVGRGGDDSILGGDGADVLHGSSGADVLSGGDGNDTITGDNSAAELITNGDFSDGGTGWTVNNPTGSFEVGFHGSTANFNRGDETTYGDSIEQDFDAPVGVSHTVSLDLIENNPGAGDHTFQIDILDDGGNVIASQTHTVTNGSTLPVSFTFAPTTDTSTIRITNTTSTNTVSTDGRVDNVSIVATDTAQGNDTIDGGVGDDLLSGGGGADSLDGGVGDDVIYGEAGNDAITGGVGADTIYGGTGADTIDSGDGNDIIEGGDGNDFIQGGIGNDLIEGGVGDDIILGGDGSDTILGGDGDDFIAGGDGADLLKAGKGNDTLSGGAGDDTLMNSAGDDSLLGGTGDDLIIATAGDDTLEGGDGADTLDGGSEDDSIVGGAGDDVIYTGLGNDEAFGGDGADTFHAHGAEGVAFNQTGTDGVASASGLSDFPTDAFSFEMQFSSTETGSTTPLASYAVSGADNEFLLIKTSSDTLNVWIGDSQLQTGVSIAGLFDGTAHSLSVTWDSATGAVEIYADGSSIYSGTHATGDTLTQGGTFVFGQEQDSVGGGFDSGEIFQGTIHNAALFNDVRTPAEIALDAGDHEADTSDPNLIAGWVPDADTGGLTDLTGNHTIVMSGDTQIITTLGGNDTIVGEEGGVDDDRIDFSAMSVAVNVTYTANEVGSATDGTNTLSFSEIEAHTLTAQNDSVDASATSLGVDVDGNAGDDTLIGGTGDDTLAGGDGDDYIEGGAGNDFLTTGLGQDTLIGGDGDDTLMNSDGDDSLDGGAGDDSIVATGGEDTLRGGTGADTMDGGADADTFIIEDGFGNDVIIGGEGTTDPGDEDFDTIDLSALSGPVTVTYTGDEAGTITDGTDTITFSDIEHLILTDQNDSVDASITNDGENGDAPGVNIEARGGDDTVIGGRGGDTIDGGAGADSIEGDYGDDVLSGGSGDDTIKGGQGNDSILGGDGADSLEGGEEGDTLDGGDGADLILGGDGNDSLQGGDGDDSLFGGEGDDTQEGGAGNDSLQGHLGDDSLEGGAGNDTLWGGGTGEDTLDGGDGDDRLGAGTEDDSVTGGAGNDTFLYDVGDGNDTITDFNTGNTGTLDDGDSTNNDFIDLSGYYDNLSELYADQADDGILNQSNATDSKGRSTDYSDNDQFGDNDSLTFQGASADNSSFTQENTGVVCFTSGTAIRTPRGDVLIDDLRVGDLVTTMDNGPQAIRWIGRRAVGPEALASNIKLRPVLIPKGTFGARRNLLISRQHALLINTDQLARAIHLTKINGLSARIAHGKKQVTYVHLMFDAHEIIFAEGVASESFYPGETAIEMLRTEARQSLVNAFPEFPHIDNVRAISQIYGQTARTIVSRREIGEHCFARKPRSASEYAYAT